MITFYYILIAVCTYIISCYILAPLKETDKKMLAFKDPCLFFIFITFSTTELPASSSFLF